MMEDLRQQLESAFNKVFRYKVVGALITVVLIAMSLIILSTLVGSHPVGPQVEQIDSQVVLEAPDTWTLRSPNSFNDFPAISEGNMVNAVIEIPAGTCAKWEVDKSSGELQWEFKNGEPRIVRYLGYPANYGMIPSTLLKQSEGGDGDPLDILILGPAIPRGSVVRARPIAILKTMDDGEVDDKIIAVRPGTSFGDIFSLEELRTRYPGVTEIIATWFANYKGPGKIDIGKLGSTETAWRLIRRSIVGS